MPEETFGEKAGNKLEEGLEQVKAGVKDLAAKAGIGSGDADTRGRRDSRTRTATSAARSHGRSAAARGRSGVTRATSTAKSTATRAKSGATRTKDELYADAARLGIKGRSKMTKAELEKAVRRG
jgi:hypothetical protein